MGASLVVSEESEAPMSDLGAIPEPSRSITIDFDAGPIVGSHGVVVKTLGWYSTSDWLFPKVGEPGYLDLAYSFVPPLTPEEHHSPIFPWKVWELEVHDDVGTEYDSSQGG